MTVCTVIPAAGRGTRLGIDVPKILAPVVGEETIWSIMRAKLGGVADHINVVMSPWGEPIFRERLTDADREVVSVSIQPEPIGMGDAVFQALPFFSRHDVLLVVWGDQVNISRRTLEDSLKLHGGAGKTVVVPAVRLPQPYVEYRFNGAGLLERILETREGDKCAPNGLSDVGVFVLTVDGLAEAWRAYLAGARLGAQTGEIDSPVEARGINTREDLAHAAAYVAALKAGDRV
jgi:bifunctional UDP-N-acetylglucosamine pyrophosphorylase / glucosamine-1-phosphate N-acetyltransferase